MTDSSGFVLFKRDSQDQESSDDVWDDSALIRAYDQAVNAAKDKLASKLRMSVDVTDRTSESDSSVVDKAGQTYDSNKNRNGAIWKVGDFVRAPYSVDGVIYEAVVQKINKSKGSCRVKFIGYENEEDVIFHCLQHSEGAESRRLQMEACAEISSDEMESEVSNEVKAKTSQSSKWEPIPPPTSFFPSGPSHFPIPPPPPPSIWPGGQLSGEDPDALYSMLMSWYMAGYHTGYYQGVQQRGGGKRNNSGKVEDT